MGSRSGGIVSALTHRAFALVWAGALVSNVGALTFARMMEHDL